MRRSLGKLSCPAIGHTSRKTLIFSSSYDFSTSAGNGGGDDGGGRGRGRGRGSDFPKFSLFESKSDPRGHEDETSFSSPLGHGRGKAHPTPPNIPGFSSYRDSSANVGTVSGRGRGTVQPPQFEENSRQTPEPLRSPPEESSRPRTPIFFRKDGEVNLSPKAPSQGQSGDQEKSNQPTSILSYFSGAGRGKPSQATISDSEKVEEVNRHRKPRQPMQPRPSFSKMSQEEAINKAKDALSRGDGGSGPQGGFRGVGTRGGRGRGQRGGWSARGRGRGQGRGMSYRDDEDNEEDEEETAVDKANNEKLSKYLGPNKLDLLVQAFEEASANVLPSPEEDTHIDLMHTNLLLECEPEYLMADFNSNPDIAEKPPIPLRDALEKMKPFLMAYENIQSDKEWQDVVEETMKNVPLMKEIVDYYSGPNRVTAKRQGEELERVAKTLPGSAPPSVKRFTERAVRSLQSNPGWGFDKKCQFMDKLVWEVSQSYK